MTMASDALINLRNAKQTARQSSLWKHYISIIILIVAGAICKTNFKKSLSEDLEKQCTYVILIFYSISKLCLRFNQYLNIENVYRDF